MSSKFFVPVVLTATLVAIGAARAAAASLQRLAPKDQQSLDAVAFAYFQGDSQAVLEVLSPLIASLNDNKFNSFDQALAERNVPAIGKLLADARQAMVQQGLTKQLPKPGPRETMLILQSFGKQLRALLDSTVEASADDIVGLDGFDKALWDLHVRQNRLQTANRFVEYTKQLAKAYPKGLAQRLAEEDRELVLADFDKVIGDINDAVAEAERQEVVLRMKRLSRAREILHRPGLTADRFQAAYVSVIDSRIISDYLANDQQDEPAPRPFDDKLVQEFENDSAAAKSLAGQLATKAQLLYEGLHWWYRGRYGLGPDARGLAKSPAAMRLPAAQLWLSMPAATPNPTNPLAVATAQPAPVYDRRHHYWWAWEDRRVQRYVSINDGVIGPKFTLTPEDNTRFW